MDGSLECKFLAYFGTMLTVLLSCSSGSLRQRGIAPYNASKDPLLKGVHIDMRSPLHCALTISVWDYDGGRRGREGFTRAVMSRFLECSSRGSKFAKKMSLSSNLS